MAVSFGSISTPAYLSGATINITPNAPASIAAGDYLVLLLGVKPDTSVNDETITDWDFLGEFSGGGGTTGIDTGPTLIAAYGKVAVGSDSMPTINITSTNVSWAVVYRYTNATGVWDVAVAGGVDSTTGTAVSVTCGSNPGLTAGDHYIVGFCIPTDVTTPSQFSAEGVTATGVSAWGTVTEDTEPDTNVGNDIGGVTFRGSVTTGTSSAAPVIAATAGGTTTNVRGPAILVRLREAPNPDATFSTLVGDAAASGGTSTLSGDAAFASTAGDAAADGGVSTFTGGSGAVDGTFATTAGDAAAAGGTGAFTGGGGFASSGGDAAAAGGSSAFGGDGGFSSTAGSAAADGGTGALTGGAAFTTAPGDAAAAGGSTAMTGDATFATSAGNGDAAGGDSAFGVTGTFTTTAGDAAAAGGDGAFVGDATFVSTTGDALAAGGLGSMTGDPVIEVPPPNSGSPLRQNLLKRQALERIKREDDDLLVLGLI